MTICNNNIHWRLKPPFAYLPALKCRASRVSCYFCEISDTTLAIDLDEKKRIYAELGIAEYWVIDVRAYRIFAFRLDDFGIYQQCEVSQVLPNLAIALLEQTVELLATKTNTEAAIWFSQQIAAHF